VTINLQSTVAHNPVQHDRTNILKWTNILTLA